MPKKRADELLNILHLSGHEHKLPAKVSGGQAQRASIARALSTNPDILLLDEPTASLDPVLTHEVLAAIQELKSLGKDFIFVTHEIAFVKILCRLCDIHRRRQDNRARRSADIKRASN